MDRPSDGRATTISDNGGKIDGNGEPIPAGLPPEVFEEYVPMDIFTAAAIGHFERLRELLLADDTDCDACNSGGWTPLMYAAYVGHDNAVNLLLDDGRLNVDVCTPTGCTALILASSCGNESVAYFLIQQGANINMRDMSGRTAVFYAACKGHKSTVFLLLDNNADINAKESEFGLTPLMAAAQEGHEAVVSALLAKNANVQAVSNYGHTARALAVRGGHTLVATLLDNALLDCREQSLRSEPGLSDDLEELHPVGYDRQWISKATGSPRKSPRRINSHGHRHRHRSQRAAARGISDIHAGPAAMKQLFSSSLTGEPVHPGDGLAAVDAAVDRGLSQTTEGPDEGESSSTSSSEGLSPGSDDDAEEQVVSGSQHFADMAANTIRAPSSESNDSSPQSSAVGRQLAELCMADQKSTPKAERANVSRQDDGAVANPFYVSQARSKAGSGGAAVLTESDSPSSSQEILKRRTARTPPFSPNHPRTIEEFLSSLNLSKYLSLFEEQDVNMHALLTLTDNDLKEIGLKLFGPRRKITSAIARWHGQAWTGPSKMEQAYADHLEVRLRELTDKCQHCTEQLESCQSQLRQEHDLRAVTEACLLDERTARQQLELSANGVRKVSKKARKHVDTAIRDQAKLIEQLRTMEKSGASTSDLLQFAERSHEQMQVSLQILTGDKRGDRMTP